MMYEELVKELRESPENKRLMTYAADAIEQLQKSICPHYIRNVHDRGDNSLCRKYRCEVNALPRWIPVTEQLPEKKHCVLIFTKKGGTAEGEYDGDGWTQYRWSAKMGADVVTHWMPLPEPPREENRTSGIYIHGMKMPDSCNHCRFAVDGWCYAYGKPNIDALANEGRTNFCPLVPVPPHGDLIDRAKLENDIENYVGGEESRSRFHHWVQVQSVVIPGNEGAET